MTTREIATLRAVVDERELTLSELEQRMRDLDRRYDVLFAWATAAPATLPATVEEAPEPRARRKRRPVRENAEMTVDLEALDMTGALSRKQQIIRIARATPDGKLRTVKVVELLDDPGLMHGRTREGMRGRLHKEMLEDPAFIRLRRGWFYYPAFSTDYEQEQTVNTMRWLPGNIDYSEARSIGHKLIFLAQHTEDRLVHPEQAAQRLIEDGFSSADVRELTRLVSKTLDQHGDFIGLSDGWFRLD